LTSSATAASIGINFLNIAGDTQAFAPGDRHDNAANFVASDVVGAPGFAQANWNQFRGDWSGESVNDATHANLVDADGLPVTNLGIQSVNGDDDLVNYDSNNLWASGVYTEIGGQPGVTANDTLMNGYLDDGNNGEPRINFDLKYNGETGANGILSYSVVIYFNGDGAAEQLGRYWIEDDTTGNPITDLVGIDSGDYLAGGAFVSAGTFFQTEAPQLVNVDSGNYLVFAGITADRIRIRGGGNDDPGDLDYGRAPINGIQLVAQVVPEPTTFVMAGAAVLFVVACGRRHC
jgi:hypothetical protein